MTSDANAERRAHRPIFESALLRAGSTQQVRLTTFINHGSTPVSNVQGCAHDAQGAQQHCSAQVRGVAAMADGNAWNFSPPAPISMA